MMSDWSRMECMRLKTVGVTCCWSHYSYIQSGLTLPVTIFNITTHLLLPPSRLSP